MKLVAPSVLAADFNNLAAEIEMINNSEADLIHCDIMDGKPFDVHLMIVNPERYIDEFCKSGASIITVHIETCPHLDRTIQQIKDNKTQASVCLNPHTPVALLDDIIQNLDMVLLMSVNPGFGGQKFIENTYRKVSQLKDLIGWRS